MQAVDAIAAGRVLTYVNPIISDELLAAAYLRMQAERHLETVFHDGPIGLIDFVQWGQRNLVVPGFARADDQSDFAGLGWVVGTKKLGDPVDGVTPLVGEVGMVFFHEFQKFDIPARLAAQMLDIAFGTILNPRYGAARYLALYGTTPVKNRTAKIFLEKMGFEKVGALPQYVNWRGSPGDAVVSYMSKQMWEEKHGRA